MIKIRCFFRVRITFALDRLEMDNNRSVKLFCLLQKRQDTLDIVAVRRAEIIKSQYAEYILRQDFVLEITLEVGYSRNSLFTCSAELSEKSLGTVFERKILGF